MFNRKKKEINRLKERLNEGFADFWDVKDQELVDAEEKRHQDQIAAIRELAASFTEIARAISVVGHSQAKYASAKRDEVELAKRQATDGG